MANACQALVAKTCANWMGASGRLRPRALRIMVARGRLHFGAAALKSRYMLERDREACYRTHTARSNGIDQISPSIWAHDRQGLRRLSGRAADRAQLRSGSRHRFKRGRACLLIQASTDRDRAGGGSIAPSRDGLPTSGGKSGGGPGRRVTAGRQNATVTDDD